jgi:hypothetical protein
MRTTTDYFAIATVDFRWKRPITRRGFEWRESGDDSGDMHLVAPGSEMANYEPFKESGLSGLFKTFAFLRPEPAAMVWFANNYGPLGADLDTFSTWTESIRRLKRMVDVWDAMRDGDDAKLRAAVRVKDAAKAGHAELIEAGLSLLFHGVAGPIWGNAFIFTREKGQHLPICWNAEEKRVELSYLPASLLAAMYVQAWNAIVGYKRFQKCRECERWFELRRRETVRVDKQICSGSCKVRAHQKRLAWAKDLAGKGWVAKRISKETGVDIETVTRWFKQGKLP